MHPINTRAAVTMWSNSNNTFEEVVGHRCPSSVTAKVSEAEPTRAIQSHFVFWGTAGTSGLDQSSPQETRNRR